jgi:hypothetical protein
MTITINIPDAVSNRVLNGFASAQGYQDTIDGQPNPETKQQFLKRRLIEFIHQAVKFQESEAAGTVAKQAAIQRVDSEITLT